MNDTIVTIISIYGIITTLIVWSSITIWTNKDIKERVREPYKRIAATITVLIFNIVGLILYIALRPRETLSETYEKSLEEEALLQEIEEKLTCAGCGQATKENWQVCPNCHTQLKRVCINCRRLIELTWNICPYCTTVQRNTETRNANIVKKREVTYIDNDE